MVNYYNKTDIALTIVALLVLLIVTISASYAYFASGLDTGNGLVLNSTTSTAPTFMAYAADPISLMVEAADMATPSTTASKTDVGSIVATLASPDQGKTVSCTYDIELVWDTEDQYTIPTATLGGDYPYEISLSGTQVVQGDNSGHVYSKSTLNETNLTDFTWIGSAGSIGRNTKVITGAEIYSNSVQKTTITWNFSLNFYSLPTDQSDLAGKNYGAHLSVTNVLC